MIIEMWKRAIFLALLQGQMKSLWPNRLSGQCTGSAVGQAAEDCGNYERSYSGE